MKKTHKKIQQWYQKHGRLDLPWRTTKDPYLIYLSEVMLQQTQVKTVLDRFYYPFLERFPTLESLALAPLDDVLKMWEGLGYYSRAKNLHATAQILSRSSYTLPTKISELVKLPGIGRKTANVILGELYGLQGVVVDTHVKRISRHLGLTASEDPVKIEKDLEKVVPEPAWNLFSHLLIWHGRMICIARRPDCRICPLASGLCPAAARKSPQKSRR